MLEPRRVLTFREVARRGSFSRAAEALSLSQPAVSQQITALETQLGTRLLERGRGGAVPTEAGALLLAHADALADRLELAGTQLAALVAEERAALRVGAVPSALATIVPAALAALVPAGPPAAVREGATEELADAVRGGRLDAAVCFQDAAVAPREHAGTRRVELAEEPFVAVLWAGHRLAGRSEIELLELADDPWQAPSTDGMVVRGCRRAGFEPRLVIVARDPLAVRAIAAAGLAVSLTPALLGGIGLPGIATPAVADAPQRALYLLLPEGRPHPLAEPFVVALRDAVADAARAGARSRGVTPRPAPPRAP